MGLSGVGRELGYLEFMPLTSELREDWLIVVNGRWLEVDRWYSMIHPQGLTSDRKRLALPQPLL